MGRGHGFSRSLAMSSDNPAPLDQSLVGAAATSALGAALVAVPLIFDPPYAFYLPMKVIVAFACAVSSWAIFTISRAFLPLIALLLASGAIELFGKMRRPDWVPFNLSTSVLLLFASICIGRHAYCNRKDAETEEST